MDAEAETQNTRKIRERNDTRGKNINPSKVCDKNKQETNKENEEQTDLLVSRGAMYSIYKQRKRNQNKYQKTKHRIKHSKRLYKKKIHCLENTIINKNNNINSRQRKKHTQNKKNNKTHTKQKK